MSEKMQRNAMIIRIASVALLAALLCISVGVAVKLSHKTPNQVAITGVGKVSFEPDKAKVTLGVQIDQARTAEQALSQLTESASTITESVKALGITDADIQTLNYSIYPHYEYSGDGSSSVSGYDANQQIIVTVMGIIEDKDKIGNVIKAATESGSNQLQGVVYDVSTVEELKQQARVLALKDAREKAQHSAQELNVELGEIVSWWDNVAKAPGINNGYYESSANYGYGGGYGTPGVYAGNQEIIVDATVNFEIKD